jgi:hypothetical protein
VPRQRNTIEEKKAIKEGRIPEDWKAKPAKNLLAHGPVIMYIYQGTPPHPTPFMGIGTSQTEKLRGKSAKEIKDADLQDHLDQINELISKTETHGDRSRVLVWLYPMEWSENCGCESVSYRFNALCFA